MKPETAALKTRTKRFALDVLDFLDSIPDKGTNRRICWQLSDAATSVGANYRAVCRAKLGRTAERNLEARRSHLRIEPDSNV
jgi:four helix bundle protein